MASALQLPHLAATAETSPYAVLDWLATTDPVAEDVQLLQVAEVAQTLPYEELFVDAVDVELE